MAFNAGSSAIKEVLIYNHKKEVVDITDLVAEINVYEDMFSNVMNGNLLVIDAVGLISNLPIIGQEKVQFQISSEIWGTKSFEFFIYSVTNREVENYATTNYQLNFVSIEAIENKTSLISKSYKGTQGQIVKRIFEDTIESTKTVSIENTNHNTSLIVPYWSAFEAINWISSKAMPSSGSRASFFFYENQDGFNFKSIDSLSQQESLGTLSYRDSNIASSTSIKDKINFAGLTIEDYDVLEYNDTLRALSSGLYGTTTYVKDVTKNEWYKQTWNYLPRFKDDKHLNKNAIVSKSNAFGIDNTKATSEVRLAYTHDNIFNNITDTFFPNEWVGSRISLLSQINATRLNISLPGHIAFSAGKTINLVFPKNSGTSKGVNSIDPYLSGKYLITSVRHNFQLKFHRVSFEAIQESFQGDTE
jgi:hypothetical protein